MADHRIDEPLEAQLNELRMRAEAQLNARPADSGLLIIVQALNRLRGAAQRGAVDEMELAGALSTLAQQLDAEQTSSVSADRLALIRETLPSSQRDTLLARNQARLVERSLDAVRERGDEALDAVQAAVMQFAQAFDRQTSPELPTPAQLQAKVTNALDERMTRQAALIHRTDQASATAALSTGGELPGAQPMERVREELFALLNADTAGANMRLREALLAGEMVLVTSDKRQGQHHVTFQPEGVPQPSEAIAAPDAGRPAAADEHVTPVAHAAADEAAYLDALARLETSRAQLADKRRVSRQVRDELEAQQARVAQLAQLAQRSRHSLVAARQQAREGAAGERAAAAVRGAAERVLGEQLAGLGSVVGRLLEITRERAASARGGARGALLEQGRQIDSLVTRLEGVRSDAPAAAVRTLADEVTETVTVASTRAQKGASRSAGARTAAALVTPLVQRAKQAGSAAHQAALAAAFVSSVPSATPHLEDVSLEGAVSEASALRRRFDEVAYGAGNEEDRVLAQETALGTLRPWEATQREQVAPPRPYAPLPVEQFPVVSASALVADADSRLRTLQGLQKQHEARSVDLFAESAGSELARSVGPALQHSGNAGAMSAEMVGRALAALHQSRASKQAQKLAKSAARTVTTDSGRRELGMPTSAHFEMQPNTPAPLFSRKTSVDRSGVVGDVYLPVLYQVTGLESPRPLRKRRWAQGNDPLSTGRMLAKTDEQGDGIDLTGKNLDLLKAIEKYFGKLGTRGEDLAPYGEDATQEESYQKNVENEFDRGAYAISEWVGSRHQDFAKNISARPVDMFSTGQLDPETMISNLKSEARQIPTTVRERLATHIPGDLSDVRVYSGPIARMAAAAMGAHAFTLGKNIFFGDGLVDFESPEGGALLAHEAVHTQHFGQSGSVEAKEQEAEAMERRVMQAFGAGQDRVLATEDRGQPNQGGALTAAKSANDFSVSEPVPAGKGGFRPKYDPNTMIDAISEMVIEFMAEEMVRARERHGSDM